MRQVILLCFVACVLNCVRGYEVVDCDICHRSYHQVSNSHHADQKKGCSKNGVNFNDGDSYRHSHLRYICENGIMAIKGCYVDESRDLGIGENYVDHQKNYSMKCYKKDNSIGYKEITCGSLGFNEDFTSCKTALRTPTNYACGVCQENSNLGKISAPTQNKTISPLRETYVQNANRCTKNGQFFNEGDIYRNNHLRYKCENGVMRVKGCYAGNDKDLDVGQNFVDHVANSVLHCQKLGNKIGYKLNFCSGTGFNEDMSDCKGTSTMDGNNAENSYDEVIHHKVYVTKNNAENKVDEERVMHVNCDCN
uniref:Abnormal cell migration protein 18-like fibronectin type I domain-containing protein n=1 Tax=Acrobeloides nanus TaxID=290746 RepID=A0A914E9G5_9BILA